MSRQILADFNDEGVWVYQAFKPEIVAWAVEHGTFGLGFGLDRMTWIKPSFGWMLYRSGYATKHRQEAIARILITHEGFLEILGKSMETSWSPGGFFEDEASWRRALKAGEVRHQWDPDRAVTGEKLDRRAIQLGIRGQTVLDYVHRYILRVDDVTDVAHAIRKAVGENLPEHFVERVYPVEAALAERLGILPGSAVNDAATDSEGR